MVKLTVKLKLLNRHYSREFPTLSQALASLALSIHGLPAPDGLEVEVTFNHPKHISDDAYNKFLEEKEN